MDIRTLYLVVGIVYLVVPFSLYLSTRKTTDLQIRLWNLAWISMGVGALLVGMRDSVSPWMSFMAAHIAFMLAYLCRATVLMVERECSADRMRRNLFLRYGPIAAVYLGIFWAMWIFEANPVHRMIFVNAVHVFFFVEFSLQSLRIHRETRRGGALLLSVMGALIALGFLIRAVGLFLGTEVREDTFYPSVDQVVIMLLALIGFVIGQFGFVQLRLERVSSQKQQVMAQLMDAETMNQRLQQVIHEKNENLKRASVMTNVAGVGMMAGSLTHELSQPLTAIRLNLGFVERLVRERTDLGPAREALHEVVSESERLYAIVTRLRALFQKGAAQHSAVHLADVVGAVLKTVEAYCTEAKIQVRASIDASVQMMGDVVQLQTLFFNLINNAIEAIRHSHPDGNLWVSVQREGSLAVCLVRDDGPGFPKSVNFNALEVFVSSKPGGSGIGLWLSQTIAESHGGRIAWQNDPETGGAWVRIELPIL
jgi:signal transduction histidine kinase